MGDWKISERDKMHALAQNRPVVEVRTIENHMLTEGLRDAAAEGEVPAQSHVDVVFNMAILLGGLSRFKGLTEEQRAAAALYRSLFDGAQIGGARAIDYSQPAVDVSGGASNPADGGMDARRRYAEAAQMLGQLQSILLERIVCHDMSLRDIARRMGEGEGSAARERVKGAVLVAVDRLVDHFGMLARPGRARVRGEGMPATSWEFPQRPVDDSGQ